MEGAVSAHAANSKWLGLGLGIGFRLGRQREVFGKQSLLSTNGVGYTRKMMMSNSMNCMRRFRLESSWMAMRPRAIVKQRFSASGSGRGDVENGYAYIENDDDYDENSDSDDDYVENCDDYDENGDPSPLYAMNKQLASCVEYAVTTCVGVGLVMFGIGCLLGYFYLRKSTHGIIYRIAVMAIVLFHAVDLIWFFVKLLLADKLVREGFLRVFRSEGKSYYMDC
ncbi:hypothetical protein OROGR_026808 [Orobanche gracilis]